MEVAQEVDEEYELSEKMSRDRQHSVRDIHSSVFDNNFGVEPELGGNVAAGGHQNVIVGFTQCFIYLCEWFNILLFYVQWRAEVNF